MQRSSQMRKSNTSIEIKVMSRDSKSVAWAGGPANLCVPNAQTWPKCSWAGHRHSRHQRDSLRFLVSNINNQICTSKWPLFCLLEEWIRIENKRKSTKFYKWKIFKIPRENKIEQMYQCFFKKYTNMWNIHTLLLILKTVQSRSL